MGIRVYRSTRRDHALRSLIASGLLVWMFLSPLSGSRRALAAEMFTVDNPVDSAALGPLSDGICASIAGGCTLRAAIMKANHSPASGVTIQFPAGIYHLSISPTGTDDETSGDLNITQDTTLVGAGAGSTIIDGGGLDRVVHIAAGTTVTLQGLTIQNGAITGQSGLGAGLQNDGTLTLMDAVVADNGGMDATESGNAIYSQGALTLTRVVVHDNIGLADGSVYLSNSTATIIASSLYGNSTPGSGGGILCDGCALTLVDTGIDNNKAVSLSGTGSGGGVYVTNAGSALINRSALTNNSADFGGGLNNNGSTVAVLNSTISGNDATGDGGGICDCTANSGTHLYNVTIANNQADSDLNGVGAGGGLASYGSGVATDFVNSIVAINFETAASTPVAGDCFGTVTSNGYSIVNAYNSSTCTINGTFMLANPILGPLQGNRGLTLTQALLAGSPAIDAGNPAGCLDNTGSFLTVDQRDMTRPVGPQCDAGAFEYVPASEFLPFVSN
jgi:hypothetical protein